MSKLIVNNITCRNFLRYGDYETTFDYTDNELSVIVGKNGVGKSTLPIDALFYNWYGKPFRKMKVTELVNNKTKKELQTFSEITIPDGTKYKIVRERKPDTFEIFKDVNGVWTLEKPPADLKQYQRWLEEHILKMSEESFRQIVVLGSSSYKPFMELDTPKRRQVVEDLLTLRIYSYMNKIAKEKAKSLKADHAEAISKQFNDQRLLDAHKNSLLEVQNRSKTFIDDTQKEIDGLINKNKVLQENVETVQNVVDDLNKSISDANELKAEYQKAGNIVSVKTNESSHITKRANFYNDHSNCPECEQKLDQSFVQQKQNELKVEHDKIQYDIDYNEKVQTKTKVRLMEIKSIMGEISIKNDEIRTFNNQININNSNISNMNANINNFSNQDVSQIQAMIDQSTKDLTDSTSNLAVVEKDLNHYNALLELLKDDAIKADVIRDYIPLINKTVQDYLNVIGFNAMFMLDESFKEKIIIDGESLSYAALSEGQKLRLNLVLMFTWRTIAQHKSSAACSLLVMDEVLNSSLDSDGEDAMFKLIDHVAAEGDQNTLIISHSLDTQSKFEHAYEVTLNHGFSSINKKESI